MVRGRKNAVEQQGGRGTGKQGTTASDDRWDPRPPGDDPYRDMNDHKEDFADPANDDYIWPEFNDDEDD
ncbi:MAG: hypothetical protein WC586_08795 [Methanoregula sp.]